MGHAFEALTQQILLGIGRPTGSGFDHTNPLIIICQNLQNLFGTLPLNPINLHHKAPPLLLHHNR